jgi:hypothetical protein
MTIKNVDINDMEIQRLICMESRKDNWLKIRWPNLMIVQQTRDWIFVKVWVSMVVCMVEKMANLMIVIKVIECEDWNETWQSEFVVLHKRKALHEYKTLKQIWNQFILAPRFRLHYAFCGL